MECTQNNMSAICRYSDSIAIGVTPMATVIAMMKPLAAHDS